MDISYNLEMKIWCYFNSLNGYKILKNILTFTIIEIFAIIVTVFRYVAELFSESN